MKKVAFIHASLKVKNSMQQESLILHEVAQGAFSSARPIEITLRESLLESVIKDLLCSKELSEIVIITSDDACDTRIREIGQAFVAQTPSVKVQAIGAHEEFSISHEHRGSNDAEWPYVSLPVYGAWHMNGLRALATHYSADMCLIVQADSCLFADIQELDRVLATYTSRGIWGKVTHLVNVEFAVLNTQFITDVIRKYERKIQDIYKKTGNMRLLRADKPLLLCEDDSNREDLFMSYDPSRAPLNCLYRLQDFENSLMLQKFDLGSIRTLLDEKRFVPDIVWPTFLDVELIAEDSTCMDDTCFKSLIDDAGGDLFALNIYIRNKIKKPITEYLTRARKRCGMVMLEFDNKSINSLNVSALREYARMVDLIQFNIDPTVKNEMLTNMIEAVNQEKTQGVPLLVVRTSPGDVDKYSTLKMLVDRLVIKSTNGTQHVEGHIDFSPFDRIPCKKLATSLFINAEGGIAPCRFMETCGTTHGNVQEDFVSDAFEHIRQAHLACDVGDLPACAQCKEWYIPDIVQTLPRHLCFDNKKRVALPNKNAYDKARAQALLSELKLIRPLFLKELQSPLYVRSMWHNEIMYNTYWCLVRALNPALLALGDMLIEHNDLDGALDAWECVLRFDPANAHIHTRLDSMLAESASVR